MRVFCELLILHSTDGAAVGARGFLVVVVVDEAWREAECESHIKQVGDSIARPVETFGTGREMALACTDACGRQEEGATAGTGDVVADGVGIGDSLPLAFLH